MTALVVALLGAAPMEALTLPQALERALTRAPRLQTVRASVQRAEALVAQSRASWLPTVTLSGTYTQLEGNRGLAERVLLPASSANGALQLVFPLLAVPRWVATGQAELGVEAAKADEDEVRRALVSLVGRAWLTVELQHALVAVAERATKTSAEQLELASVRQRGGLGTKLDLVRAQREVKDNEGRLARARVDLVTAREVLGVLIGAPGPVDVSGGLSLAALPAADALDEVVKERPDVVAATTRVAQASRAVEQSWVDYLPTAAVTVTPTAQTPPTPTQPALGVTAQLTGQVQVFDGLSRSALRKEREAALTAAKAQAEDVGLRARSELRLAFEVLALREEAAAAAAASATLALEAEALARVAWKDGATSNVELIEAERSARDAETLAQAARTSAWSAKLDVLVAAGRDPVAR
ncbi:MAG: TolC family protein [Myxococcaceae bacterium]|nr:TolC family protein [Myxococcaceae bacterium]